MNRNDEQREGEGVDELREFIRGAPGGVDLYATQAIGGLSWFPLSRTRVACSPGLLQKFKAEVRGG